jgi:hypothetical protein
MDICDCDRYKTWWNSYTRFDLDLISRSNLEQKPVKISKPQRNQEMCSYLTLSLYFNFKPGPIVYIALKIKFTLYVK